MAKVLVVEDEKLVRATVRKVLQHAGHEVTEACTGTEGIDLYRNKPFDLVICDLIMPDKDGVTLIKELKRDFPDARIIAMSGGGRMGNLDFLKLADLHGADETLPKPYAPDALLTAINRVLARR